MTIVDRLRTAVAVYPFQVSDIEMLDLLEEAAKEIERLMDEVEYFKHRQS